MLTKQLLFFIFFILLPICSFSSTLPEVLESDQIGFSAKTSHSKDAPKFTVIHLDPNEGLTTVTIDKFEYTPSYKDGVFCTLEKNKNFLPQGLIVYEVDMRLEFEEDTENNHVRHKTVFGYWPDVTAHGGFKVSCYGSPKEIESDLNPSPITYSDANIILSEIFHIEVKDELLADLGSCEISNLISVSKKKNLSDADIQSISEYCSTKLFNGDMEMDKLGKLIVKIIQRING